MAGARDPFRSKHRRPLHPDPVVPRTLTPWKPWAVNYDDHFLLKSFDIVRWIPMTESEFNQVRSVLIFRHDSDERRSAQVDKDYNSGKYEVKIESFKLSAREMAALELSTAAETAALKAVQRANMTRLGAK